MKMTLTIEGNRKDLMNILARMEEDQVCGCDCTPCVAPPEPVQTEMTLPESPRVDSSNEGPGEAPAEAEQPTVSKTDIRAKALELTKAGHDAYVKETFRLFGSEKLSGLKEEDYPKVLAKLEEF